MNRYIPEESSMLDARYNDAFSFVGLKANSCLYSYLSWDLCVFCVLGKVVHLHNFSLLGISIHVAYFMYLSLVLVVTKRFTTNHFVIGQ